jgi:galactose oxidase
MMTATWALVLGVVLVAGGQRAGNGEPAAPRHHQLQPVPVAAALGPAALPRTGWTVSADSAESGAGNYSASQAIDGDASTFWHTRWTPTVDPLPHTVTIDMHATNTVAGLDYLPRPAATGRNGVIGSYKVETSSDGTNWGTPNASGTWADDSTEKVTNFAPVQARFVRLTALSEAGGRGQWSSAAEVNVLGSSDPNLPRAGWTVTADSQETAAENGAATNAIDANAATFWHTRWSTVVDPLPHALTIDTHATVTVGGLSYLPRPASTGRNGVIGSYRVETSPDGTAWTQRASGTWADDSSQKAATFPAVPARFVRLTALSEAGGRGQWTSAAEVNLQGAVMTPPASLGRWSAPVGFPLVPVAAALLPTGRLLTWSSFDPYTFGGSGTTQTATYDPVAGTVTQRTVTETGHDMFCPGTAMLTDGRVLVNGGDDAAKTSIYDPATNTWTAGPAMTTPRGYNADTTLPDGRVLTLGGSWSGGQGGKNGEVWSGAAWSPLPGVPVAPMLTADPQGVYRQDNHGWLFVTAGGRVLQAGPSHQLNWYTTTGSGGTAPAGNRADDGDAMNGNAVMYDIGKILTVGGATAYQDVDATANAFVVDVTSGSAVVRRVASMSNRRAFANSVVLPDGTVLVVGGQSHPVPFSDDTAVLAPELWDPATERFTTLAPMAVPRTYHSIAILLPDGRVLSGGGGLCGGCATNHADAQVFTPPYLLNADGTLAARPAITTAPATVTAGASFTVTTDRATPRFSLIRLASTTHSVNNDQRRIPLAPTATSGTTYTLQTPVDPGVTLPGYYLLFALTAAGVPSVAAILRVS